MRQSKEILLKIKELKEEKLYWQGRMSNFEFTNIELIEGSSAYGKLQERETNCIKQVDILEWVIQ